jgi:four helix bundle protein
MNTKIDSFEDLIVWQKAIKLAVKVYEITGRFPKEEIYGLTSQIRRAACSVSLNIAEGSVKSTKQYATHCITARGSASEVLSGALLARELGFLSLSDMQTVRAMVDEETRMLNTMIPSLTKRGQKKKTNQTHVS